MQTIIKTPELKVDSTQDGVWLHFKTSTGNRASVNLHVTFDKHNIIDAAIREWAREYATQHQS